MNTERIIGFIGGLLVGGGISYALTRYFEHKKYAKELEKFADYVESSAKSYSNKQEELEAEKKKYDELLNEVNKKAEQEAKEKEARKMSDISLKVIDADEASNLNYPIVYFNFYTDGTVTDNNDELVESPESFLGENYQELLQGIIDNEGNYDIYLSSAFFRKVFVISPMETAWDGYEEETAYGDDDDEEDY